MHRRKVLKGMFATLVVLIVLYSIAVLISLVLLLLLTGFLVSLLSEELMTQPVFIILNGSVICILGGIIDLIGAITLQGSRFQFERGVVKGLRWKGSGHRYFWSSFFVLGVLWFIMGLLMLPQFGEAVALLVLGELLLLLLYLRWNLLDAPARTLADLGSEKMRKWSTIGSVPMVLHALSYFALIGAFANEDAPLTTIATVYLEVIFVLSVSITFLGMIVLLKKLNREIEEM
ncbi:MAG: hypothetical protein R6V01_10385 [Thermoplasmatota archaeon]